MIDLQALESAFEKIGQVGKGEETFSIAGTPVTVRALTDSENVQIWKYAIVALESNEDAAAQQEWMHRMKVATLSHSIVQIGDVNLREKLVSTGDTLSDGTPVSREKSEVVRQVLAQWGSAVLLRLFARYGEFVHRIEDQAEKAIQYDPLDYDAEVKRLEERISELKERKESEQRSRVDPLAQGIQKTLDAVGGQALKVRQQDMADLDAMPRPAAPQREELLPDEFEEPSAPRRQSGPMYTEEQVRQSLHRNAAPQEMPAEAEWDGQARGWDPDSSFIDPSDPEAVMHVQAQQAQLMAMKQKQLQEHQNLVEQRRASLEGNRQQEASTVPVRSGRVPPHMRAAATQAAVQAGTLNTDAGAVPVYQMPTQTLSPRRGASQEPAGAPSLNPNSVGGVNPKFKSPR